MHLKFLFILSQFLDYTVPVYSVHVIVCVCIYEFSFAAIKLVLDLTGGAGSS